MTDKRQPSKDLSRHKGLMTEQYSKYADDIATIYAEEKAKRKELEGINEKLRQEIAEREQAEAALRESEERFRSIVENSHGGIGIVDDNFKIKYINEQITAILGYSKKEMIGQDFRDFLHGKFIHSLVITALARVIDFRPD